MQYLLTFYYMALGFGVIALVFWLFNKVSKLRNKKRKLEDLELLGKYEESRNNNG